ncbi:MAG: hypothetical protein QOD99_2033, partial [Chthoniobacter sp.]|nr:hypothetical protein [Chthoniobacter sp.]
MKRVIFLLAAAAFFLPTVGFAGPTARIAAWNIASGRSNTGGTPIPPDRIERLANVIAAKIKPDVMVLEEVWPSTASEDLAKAATKAGFELVAVKMPPQASDVVQLVSVLKRPSVQLTDVQLIDKSNDIVDGDDPEKKTTRKAVQAKVKIDHFDFYLVGVHLKS